MFLKDYHIKCIPSVSHYLTLELNEGAPIDLFRGYIVSAVKQHFND
jgi:hypothetical protein